MKNTNFKVILEADKIKLHFENGVTVQIFESAHLRFKLAKGEIFLLLKKNQVKAIALDKEELSNLEFDKVVILNTSALDLEPVYLLRYLSLLAEETGIKLSTKISEKLPDNIYKQCQREFSDLIKGLSAFGIKFEKKKYVSPKAQHRWKKEISEIVFKINRTDSQAAVIWCKSKEMVILAGAQMSSEIPLLKDGTMGFGARFALTLRKEQKEKWNPETYKTTEDIILKSVNEVGHFLYFAGTNSWLEMFNDEGRSIHELTVVK